MAGMRDNQGNRNIISSRGKCLLYVDHQFVHRYFCSEKSQMVLELVCSKNVLGFLCWPHLLYRLSYFITNLDRQNQNFKGKTMVQSKNKI